jgi:hypothetical protein
MTFEINSKKDKFIEKVYNFGMKKFNAFFNLNIPKGKLKIFLLQNRKDIDILRVEKTESWIVGWSKHDIIFLLDRDKYEKFSNHKYSDKEYSCLILHEMVHFFHNQLIKRSNSPAWLNEGLAIFLSGQNKLKKRPVEFKKFLSFYNSYGKEIYHESGFVIEFLVAKFGKIKLIKLIKETEKCKNKKDFYSIFKKIYGFDLNYNEINKRYKK